jgi:homoserine O-acetyltransferase/O-succinyltransferase
MTMPKDLDIDVGPLELDCGITLPAVRQRVTIDGDLSAARDNVVFAPHALTGSSRVAEWWPGIAGGVDALFDRERCCIIGINVLGGCYGSSGVHDHPELINGLTVRDIVRAQVRVFDTLGIDRLALVIGGSLGGMQTLQWAIDAPERVASAIVIGAHDHHSTMGIALNAVQRAAIELDSIDGIGLARKIAVLSYKSESLLTQRHGRKRDRNDPSRFDIEGYLDVQASRFIDRMDGRTYAALTRAMDSFDVRDRVLTHPGRVTFVGISSDWLFRSQDVRSAAELLGAHYLQLDSDHGHDAFLAETGKLRELLAPALL